METLKTIRQLKLFFLKWSVLHPILSGIVGKSTFVISLAVPLSRLVKIGIDLSGYQYLLGGAVSISICFILDKVFVPKIIAEFLTPSKYGSHLIKREEGETLDFTGEFMFLNNYKSSQIPLEIEEDVDDIKKFLPIHEGKQLLGTNTTKPVS